MEPEQFLATYGNTINQGLKNLAQLLIEVLFSFRIFCNVISLIATLIGGWLQPIIYRDAGERALRGSTIWIVLGLLGWGIVVGLNAGSLVYYLAALWSVGLVIADWLAALDRRRRRAYMFSRFIGWPRLLPISAASYPLPPLFVLVIGLGLVSWRVDVIGGIMLIVSAAAVLVRLWVIVALRREDAFDLLDASWLAEDRTEASATLAGPNQGVADEGVARAITTVDMVRRFSI